MSYLQNRLNGLSPEAIEAQRRSQEALNVTYNEANQFICDAQSLWAKERIAMGIDPMIAETEFGNLKPRLEAATPDQYKKALKWVRSQARKSA